MKDLKSTLTQHFIIGAAITALLIAFMALPFLEGTRASIAAATGLSSGNGLWLPVTVLILGTHALLFRFALARIARPFSRLVVELKHGEQGFAFRSRSKSREEDALKHAIEASLLKAREARDQVDVLERELERATDKRESAEAKVAKLSDVLDAAETDARELREENERLRASKVALELSLENERKAKVGVEVEKRSEEIYAQMERAVEAAAFKSIWIPSLVHELKAPIAAIQDRAGRLQASWQDASFAKVSEAIEDICQRSAEQLEIIDGILARGPKEFPMPAAPAEAEPAPSEDRAAPRSDDSSRFPPPPDIAKRSLKLDLAAAPKTKKGDPATENEVETTPAAEPPALDLSDAETLGQTEKDETEEAAPLSPYDLRAILRTLVADFSPLAPDAHLTYDIDEDLEVEIEDQALLDLLHRMVETAIKILSEGEIVVGIDLKPNALIVDITCDGDLSRSAAIDMTAAQQAAQELGGEIEVERSSDNELHLSFEYAFADNPPAASTLEIVD